MNKTSAWIRPTGNRQASGRRWAMVTKPGGAGACSRCDHWALGSDLPFTFAALLGMLNLSSMLMKNAIVLADSRIGERKVRFITLCIRRGGRFSRKVTKIAP
ncbi:hypothetical protein ACGLWX_15400 [Halomonas sp. HMF6819]|uniref:hypothetical protein n=1 Tax=Halomonas sp. HMF6819 TaxID=3373085 RepID=UPI0037B6FE73